MIGCTNVKNSKEGGDKEVAVTDTMDSPEIPDTVTFETELIKYDRNTNIASVEINVDFPKSNNQDLVNSICRFIADNLDYDYDFGEGRVEPSEYKGDITDGKKMVSFWGGYYLNELEECEGNYQIDSIYNIYNGDKYVSYRAELFVEYRGQAHGRGSTRGATFRKSDGKRITLIADTTNVKYKELLRQTAKQYFKDADYQISDSIAEIYVNNWTEDVLPWNHPYVDDKYVYYGTPYDMGSYILKIPLSIMTEFLSEDTHKLLGTKGGSK